MGTDRGQKVAVDHRRVAGHRRGPGRGVTASSATPSSPPRARSRPSDDPDVLTVQGDIADPATAERVVDAALERFGRIDTLVNNAGHLPRQALHRLHRRRLRRGDRRQPRRLLPHHPARRRADARAGRRPRRQHHHQPRRPRPPAFPSVLASLTKGGLDAATKSLAIEYADARACGSTPSRRAHQDPDAPRETHEAPRRRCTRSAAWARSSDIVDAVLYLENARRSSPARSCTSTAARAPATETAAPTAPPYRDRRPNADRHDPDHPRGNRPGADSATAEREGRAYSRRAASCCSTCWTSRWSPPSWSSTRSNRRTGAGAACPSSSSVPDSAHATPNK